MSSIDKNEFRAYNLGHEIWNDFLQEKTDSAKNSKSGKFSVSVYALNFAMHQRIDDVAQFVIEHYKTVNPKALNQKTSEYELTPLHIATILRRSDLVSLLVKAGVEVDPRDHHQWTPLHHCALSGNPELTEYLIQNGADQKALTDAEGTYQDISRLTQPPQSQSDQRIPLQYQEEEGKAKELTHAEFEKLTCAKYLAEENFADRVWMIQQWKSKEEPKMQLSPLVHKFSKQQFLKFLSKPPIHVLKKISSSNIGVFTTADYKAGEVLGEYRTHLGGPGATNDYVLNQDWQGLHFRNEIPMINDGFPNAMMVSVDKINGLKIRHILISTAPIQAGEQICWDYGSNHAIKAAPYLEFRAPALRKFVNECKLDEVTSLIEQAAKSYPLTFEESNLASQFKYIIETPSVLIRMIWDRSVKADRLMELLNRYYIVYKDNDHISKVARSQRELIKWAELGCRIQDELAKSSDRDAKLFAETVEKLLGDNPVNFFVFARDLFPKLEKQYLSQKKN